MSDDRQILFLELVNGRVLFDEWYKSIKSIATRAYIAGKLNNLENFSFNNYKSVGGGIYELRIFIGPAYRIYFAFVSAKVILILIGGNKASQKEDIVRAKKLWREFKYENKNT